MTTVPFVHKETVRDWLQAAARYAPVRGAFAVLSFVSKCLAEPGVQAAKYLAEVEDEAFARRVSPSLTVLHGPFAGLRYPSARSVGSALVPKLLGSYEHELHGAIERILANEYSDVIDVGSAEGYYAIGFGMRFPRATVHAFDTSSRAQQLCAAMARANGVGSRLRLGGLCDEAALLGLALGPRALVLSDCEGYEARLFTPRAAEFLAPHDVLIEVHDADDPTLSETLQARFAATHDVTVVDSVDDKRKLRGRDYPELAAFDVKTRHRLVREGRASIMEWLLFTSKRQARA
jgi:hypothetical protein